MPIGYLALVLHAHLPFVRHPESDYVLEEEWLFEAITETYIPLLHVFEGLKRDGIDFKITMSMTPPLVSMLRDPLLQERYDDHLAKLEELVELEVEHNANNGHIRYLAEHYVHEFSEIRQTWERYDGDLVTAFKQFLDSNNLEIITCGATHGYLPLMKMYPQAVWAQIQVAVEHYEQNFGRPPKGIWLPECAYYEGLERMLADAGLRYFLTDGHGILYARPRPRFGSYAPIFTETGVAAFGRDHESSQQVWSSEVGYPGAAEYREFYKDLGWEAEYEYIKPYIMPNGQRKNTGIKYHKITGRGLGLGDKQLYDPYWAREKAAEHAANFTYNRERQVEHLHHIMQRPPIIVSPYDAELFGHWWYEGPWFIDYLFRKSWYDQGTYRMTHLADYLQENPTQQVCRPSQSSWGYKGFHEYWLNETNAWIYPHLHKAAERMIELARREPADELEWKALNQAAREVLLAQSSDWAFIMRTGTMVPYAVRRTRSHLMRFHKLYDEIKDGKIDSGWLEKVEEIDNIFPEINYRVYRPL
ncbi:glycoside hydrolase family 57 protein [Coleofasciculus sp. FACHB-64]|uniref:glycoside hydrolase family 57 protein n=1 Tax=Cyanophyceae TaxID=3028117 RepID=UPI001684A367|nr:MULTISPECIES: glycoside hydrolase family 57 protein [unclassified Coleofasciculus]MBD1841083.1 glycoside hydrolase family 57 protein [Coleofasciculus sp. FACHB-501]MBD1877927.1 glycoside hydrolase family 57 protein [Coleofasciculus sp. FACHB-T130]MBD1889386.1 glycoside hydrolase family 57 protein [Coleofasciculus sp. FACHB-SPT9]MBD1900567.1 glycoside hydrolase family 57 protein [Coleofasciculus sp. FACHB-125]MBD1944316.1 glycoside hydrolase family 57 protein [Coleofasciculus sp. FACHB-712]